MVHWHSTIIRGFAPPWCSDVCGNERMYGEASVANRHQQISDSWRRPQRVRQRRQGFERGAHRVPRFQERRHHDAARRRCNAESDEGGDQVAPARREKGRRPRAPLLRPRVERAGRRKTGRGRRARRDSVSRPTSTGTTRSETTGCATTFDTLPAGVSFTVIMDCCHSGTNTRAIEPPDVKVKQRYLPSPWGLAALPSRDEACRGKSRASCAARRGRRARAKDIVNAELPEVLITGCRDTQTSADAFINGRYNGALTFALVEAIRKSKGRLTYKRASRSRR